MDSRTQERVERWESRPYSGGRDALTTLADEKFSGAVSAAGTWLFMLNGRVVGVVDGDIESAVEASGTIYEAPADALPLLSAMLEQGGETRGTYYTNDTPLSEVDRKLQQGSFTGYVELSEQVLSGDYYAVYYGGRRMSAAYIGNVERLLTGEEAFERADDEVGLYEVVDVDVSVTDVPGREGSSSSVSDTGASQRSSDATTAAQSASSTDDPGSTDGPDPSRTQDSTSDADVSYSDNDVDPAAAVGSAAAAERLSGSPGTAETADEDDQSGITTNEEVTDSPQSGITAPEDESDGGDVTEEANASADSPARDSGGTGDPAEASEDPDERFREEERWRETRQIPSIDPETSNDGSESPRRRPKKKQRPTPDDVASTEQALRSDMLEREDKIDHLTQRVTELEERRKQLVRERNDLQNENAELSELVSHLKDRIEQLEARIQQAGSTTDGAAANPPQTNTPATGNATPSQSTAPTTGAGTQSTASATTGTGSVQVSPQQAFEQTNVFVRYESKSQATLESAHEGHGSRSDLAGNLQLERHTQFDAANAVVDGQPYETFLQETMQYRFVEWLVRTCLFEIRETGHAGDLADLYDVIPRIDRVELEATISLEDDDTENVPDQVSFDVAAFDKRGAPLVVANCNDARDPASEEMLEQLESDASAVCANYPELGAAVIVTSSFFSPDALDLAEEITTSGFLNRNSKVSYVNLSRKQGYHCCLVESRSGGFHLTVPEL